MKKSTIQNNPSRKSIYNTVAFIFVLFFAFALQPPQIFAQKSSISTTGVTGLVKVTFIELGSVRCIPCKQMQPVMKSIETKYGNHVKVIFYDVWTPEGKPFGEQYKINLIPTQVFLDQDGKEYFRHEGFFPEEELVKTLKQKGVR